MQIAQGKQQKAGLYIWFEKYEGIYRKCGASTGPIIGDATVDISGILLIPSNVVGMGVLPILSTSRTPTLSLVDDGSIVDDGDGCVVLPPPKYGMFQQEDGGINNSRIAPQ